MQCLYTNAIKVFLRKRRLCIRKESFRLNIILIARIMLYNSFFSILRLNLGVIPQNSSHLIKKKKSLNYPLSSASVFIINLLEASIFTIIFFQHHGGMFFLKHIIKYRNIFILCVHFHIYFLYCSTFFFLYFTYFNSNVMTSFASLSIALFFCHLS